MSDQYLDQYSRAQDGDDAGDVSSATLTSASGVYRGTVEKRELQLFEAGCAWASLYGMELADVVSVELAATAAGTVGVANTQSGQP